MAVREIKKYPEKVLCRKTLPVERFNDDLQRVIDDMIETMYAAPGVGLAANQIGVPQQVIVVDVSTREEQVPLIVLINPEIISSSGVSDVEEGCLSVPGYTTVVRRAEKVKVSGLDRKGKRIEMEGDGLLARALQHELDHINGILLIDRIGRIKKEFFKKRYSKQKV
jgi:peptide deformylase